MRANVDVEQRIAALRAIDSPTIAGARLSSVQLLDELYGSIGYKRVWHDPTRLAALQQSVAHARTDGFQPTDFNQAQLTAAWSDDATTDPIDADILASDTLLRIIHHHRYGKLDPRTLDRHFNHAEPPVSYRLVRAARRVITTRDLAAELRAVYAYPGDYKSLKAELARYRRVAEAGGWPRVPAGVNLSPGMDAAAISSVRRRLAASGDYLGGDTSSTVYDEPLVAAVRAFQRRHGLAVDGIIGPLTRQAMNVPVERRIDQIRVNLERLRWSYANLPADYLLVEVAGQEVRLVRGGKVVWQTRVIVGRTDRPTPVFTDYVEYLEVNPSWTVPPTILREDILPKARANPSYVRRRGLQVIDRRGRLVAPESVNWHASNLPYTLRQPPSSRNALGQIKFMFPNKFAVYLHDTSKRSLFEHDQRLYSSGCVRVERPFELAEQIMNDPERWNRSKLEQIVATGRTRAIRLDKPFPIVFAYRTAEADEEGRIHFRNDVYGRDARVLAGLDDGTRPLHLVYAPDPLTVAAADKPSDEPVAR